MSKWVKQNDGTEIRRIPGGWEVRRKDGSVCSVSSIHDIESFSLQQPNLVIPRTESVEIRIPGKPPSSNKGYRDWVDSVGFIRRSLTEEARKYKQYVETYVSAMKLQLPEQKYDVVITVYADWETRGKNARCRVRAADIASTEKLLVDAIFDTAMPGVNQPDKWIWNEHLHKVHEPDPCKHRTAVVIKRTAGVPASVLAD